MNVLEYVQKCIQEAGYDRAEILFTHGTWTVKVFHGKEEIVSSQDILPASACYQVCNKIRQKN